MNTKRTYGAEPWDLGLVDVTLPEVYYCLYLPISLPGHAGIKIPAPLRPISALIHEVMKDLTSEEWISGVRTCNFALYDYRIKPVPPVWYMPVYQSSFGSLTETRGVPVDQATYNRMKDEPASFGRRFVKLVEA